MTPLPRLFLVAIALAGSLALPFGGIARAQQPGLTFDQAQTRTSFAREQMEAAERKLRNLERKEKSAYRSLSAAQKRHEEAKANADEATKLREAAQAEVDAARSRWEQESARLMRIHEENKARRLEK